MGAINKSNHQPHHCLLNRLFRRRSKKTSKLRVTGFCVRNSPVTGEFPAQMASNAKNVSIWWRHNDQQFQQSSPPPTRFMWSIWSEHTIDICFLLTCMSQNVTNLVSWFVVQIGHFPRYSNYIILSEMNRIIGLLWMKSIDYTQKGRTICPRNLIGKLREFAECPRWRWKVQHRGWGWGWQIDLRLC